MVTQAAKILKADAQRAATITVSVGRKERDIIDPDAAGAMMELLQLYADAHEHDADIDRLRTQVVEFVKSHSGDGGHGSVTLKLGSGASIKVTFGTSVQIKNIEEVAELLAQADKDLETYVEPKTTYKATRQLIELVADADDKLGNALRKHVVIKASAPAFVYTQAD